MINSPLSRTGGTNLGVDITPVLSSIMSFDPINSNKPGEIILKILSEVILEERPVIT